MYYSSIVHTKVPITNKITLQKCKIRTTEQDLKI